MGYQKNILNLDCGFVMIFSIPQHLTIKFVILKFFVFSKVGFPIL